MKLCRKLLFLVFSFSLLQCSELPKELATINRYQGGNKIPIHSQTWTIERGLDELASNVSDLITKKYTRFPIWYFEKNKVDAAKEVVAVANFYQYIKLTEKFIDRLREKNTIFDQAMQYFIEYATTNFYNVTANTLDSIKDAQKFQSQTILNEIPYSIKFYVMNQAYKNLTHEYILAYQSPTTPLDVDICPATDMAAIASIHKIVLWDLKDNGQTDFATTDDNQNKILAFNTNGSVLAVVKDQCSKNTIVFWDVITKKIIVEQSIAFSIKLIKACDNDNTVFNVYVEEALFPRSFSINNINSALLNSITITIDSIVCHQSLCSIWKKREHYMIANPSQNFYAPTLTITKSNCRDFFLCLQAVSNVKSTPESMHIIQAAQMYKDLTKYEQSLINKKIEERLGFFKKIYDTVR